MILEKGGGGRGLSLLTICLYLLISLAHSASWMRSLANASSCTYIPPDCFEPSCVEEIECDYGECNYVGECQCQPCFSGKTCSTYDDKYGPQFPIREDTVLISANHQGVVYKAKAEDNDLGLTCPLGPGENTRCPCAAISYHLNQDFVEDTRPFRIDESSGQIFLREGVSLQPGQEFELTIVAMNAGIPTDNTQPSKRDAMLLSVVVRQPDPLTDLLEPNTPPKPVPAKMESFPEAVPMDVSKNIVADVYKDEIEELSEQESPINGVKTHIRRKRASAGNTPGNSKMTLTELSTPPAILKPGNTIDYELTVVLPTLSTAMDLVVEVFVMDAISGITPFALCSPLVTVIGTAIQDDTGAALSAKMGAINAGIEKKVNLQFGSFYDRAIVDFGKVKNTAAAGAAGADFSDSTIKITFSAVLINNPSYTNNTVIVTAGAEYDNEKYVWVSQSTLNFSMAPDTYLNTFNLVAPTSLAEWSGGTFSLNTIITNPFDTLTLEVYSNDTMHDKFSVTQISVKSKGTSWDCMIDKPASVTYYDSVTGRTKHRATLQIPLLLRNLDLANLAAEKTDPANAIDFTFTIFLHDALVGESITVGAGLLVGTSSIWTATSVISVTAGSLTPAAGVPTAWALESISNTAVAPSGTVTWGAKATIPTGANALIDCTITGSADSVVCGVVYGKVGGNIAYLPELSSLVTYTSPNAAFQVNINSTGAGDNDIVFEVSINYPTAAPGSATITCGSFTQTLTATTTTAGVLDMKGEANSLTSPTWYLGSQAGLNVKLKFPASGVPYSALTMEAAGDLDTVGWGARVCKAEVVSAGRGVPCIGGHRVPIGQAGLLQKATTSSVFEDGISLTLGPGCGVNRLLQYDSDYEVNLRVYYEMPPSQPAVAGNFNVSVGLALGTNLIWTGWDTFTISTAALAAPDATKPPIFTLIPPTVTTIDIGIPTMLKVSLKTHPGSVGTYKITVTPADVAILSVCRIIFLGVGRSYPCVDPEPYGKETNPYQVTKLTHNTANWGAEAILQLGTLRNLGTGTIWSDNIADQDSIHLGIIVRGVAAGAGILNVLLDNTGTAVPLAQAYTITAVPPNTGTVTVTAAGRDGTADAYDGVMKIVDFKLTVPVGYGQGVKVTVRNTALTDITLCFGALFTVGKNLPCVIPPLVLSNKTKTLTEEVIVVDLLQVCHYQLVNNATENELIVSVGAMFLDGGGTSATLTAVVTEGTTDKAPVTFAITKLATPYNPGNISTDGMKLELLDNTTTTVTVGQRLKTAVAFTVPKFVTAPIEIGIMTPSDGGRAYVTVHGFNFRPGGSKNLGCLLENCANYKPTIIQNSSFDVSMIHSSQTDTLVANLKYITNTGMTHLQLINVPADDQIWIEADLLVADHPNATNGAIFDISFAVKAGPMIYVIEKQLVLSRTGAEVQKINAKLFLTDNTTTLFTPNQQVRLTLRLYHDMNVSQVEANNAIFRLYLPKYMSFVNITPPLDTFSANITGNLTILNYIDYNFNYLFFTDILESNLSVTVDPNGVLPKGMGLVNATTILRLVCTTVLSATPAYCSETAHVLYQIDGPDCYLALGLATFQDCQFSASTAISAANAPFKAKSGSGSGWFPAVRTGSGWQHHITVDFLKKTRVTKIQLEPVTSSRRVNKVKIQFSNSGQSFSDACPLELAIPANNILILPNECKFEARYGRMLILGADSAEGSAPIGVRFEWFGCAIETVNGVCNPLMKTTMTDTTVGWRHVAYDTAHALIYFCDFVPKKQRVNCYSSKDGIVWNALPSYIGRLVGFDAATAKMYALDKKEKGMVSSIDGINWSIVDTATATTILTTVPTSTGKAVPIPGKTQAQMGTPVALGPWKADYTGLLLGTAYKAKWANCCT